MPKQSINKVILIGPPGAGKSTLGKQVASRIGAPQIELDSIFHQQNWQQLERSEFIKRVMELTQNAHWVMDGNYFSSLGLDFWKQADMVIWLDYPFPLVFTRLLRRTLHRTLTKTELWNGNHESFAANFFSKNSILFWLISHWRKFKRNYGPTFDHPESMPQVALVRIRHPKDVAMTLDNYFGTT